MRTSTSFLYPFKRTLHVEIRSAESTKLNVTAITFACVLALLPSAAAQVSFFTPPPYAGAGNLFVADFNGDGKPDLLSSDGTLQLGDGNGTFTNGTPVEGTPLAVADFNGDGKQDILEQGTGMILVLLGNGDGTFQKPISTSSGAPNVSPITTVDLRGNGSIDVVGIYNNQLAVYLGNGDGTFVTPGAVYSLGSGQSGSSIVPGNFTGNGKTDLAIAGDGEEISFFLAMAMVP